MEIDDRPPKYAWICTGGCGGIFVCLFTKGLQMAHAGRLRVFGALCCLLLVGSK